MEKYSKYNRVKILNPEEACTKLRRSRNTKKIQRQKTENPFGSRLKCVEEKISQNKPVSPHCDPVSKICIHTSAVVQNYINTIDHFNSTKINAKIELDLNKKREAIDQP